MKTSIKAAVYTAASLILGSIANPIFATGVGLDLEPEANPYCGSGGLNIRTAFGCIQTESPSGFINTLIKFGVGIAGGIAMILIILSGLQMMSSVGNPERLNAAKELMSSAIVGLLMIIFSVFLLRLIGVEILAIPDFG